MIEAVRIRPMVDLETAVMKVKGIEMIEGEMIKAMEEIMEGRIVNLGREDVKEMEGAIPIFEMILEALERFLPLEMLIVNIQVHHSLVNPTLIETIRAMNGHMIVKIEVAHLLAPTTVVTIEDKIEAMNVHTIAATIEIFPLGMETMA